MALKMKAACEKCEADIAKDGEAYICVYECTFCPNCTSGLKNTCPNCSGELVRRPKPPALMATIAAQVKKKTSRTT